MSDYRIPRAARYVALAAIPATAAALVLPQWAQAAPRPEHYAVALWVTDTGCQVDIYERIDQRTTRLTDKLLAGRVLHSPDHPTEPLIPGGPGVAYKVIRHPSFPQALSAVTYTNRPSLGTYTACPTPGSTPSTTQTSPAPTTTVTSPSSTTTTTPSTTSATGTGTSTTSTTTSTATAPVPPSTRPAPLPTTPRSSATFSTTSTPQSSTRPSITFSTGAATSSSPALSSPSPAASTLPDTGANLRWPLTGGALALIGGGALWATRKHGARS